MSNWRSSRYAPSLSAATSTSLSSLMLPGQSYRCSTSIASLVIVRECTGTMPPTKNLASGAMSSLRSRNGGTTTSWLDKAAKSRDSSSTPDSDKCLQPIGPILPNDFRRVGQCNRSRALRPKFPPPQEKRVLYHQQRECRRRRESTVPQRFPCRTKLSARPVRLGASLHHNERPGGTGTIFMNGTGVKLFSDAGFTANQIGTSCAASLSSECITSACARLTPTVPRRNGSASSDLDLSVSNQ